MANPLIAAKWSAFAVQQLRFPHNCPDRKRRWHLFATSSLSTASVAVALLTFQLAGPALAGGGGGSQNSGYGGGGGADSLTGAGGTGGATPSGNWGGGGGGGAGDELWRGRQRSRDWRSRLRVCGRIGDERGQCFRHLGGCRRRRRRGPRFRRRSGTERSHGRERRRRRRWLRWR